jgi:protein TonB
MRSFLLSLVLLLPCFLIAQTTVEEPKIFTFVEQMPEFPGGDKGLIKFLQKNIKYPKRDRDLDIQGKVIIRFVVNENGKVTDVCVLRSAEHDLDEEALRVVKQMPKFKPGKQQGRAVKVYYNVPIVFKLK